MNIGADAAGTLNEMVCVPGIAALKDNFNSAEHLPGTPGVFNLASFHLHLYPKVAFYSGYRINNDSFAHMISFLSC
jgi:hypothetical protein